MGPMKSDDYDLEAIARQFGTPLFVFSGDAIRERVREFRAAFGAEWPRFELMPSLKACPILGIRALLSELDCGCDVFGPGEFEGALRANVPPSSISLNGSIKDEAIIRKAIALGVRIVIDSPREASLINDIAGELHTTARVMLRLKPEMGELSATSDFAPDLLISELSQRIKYGIPNSELAEIVDSWPSYAHLQLVGFHSHIGRHSKQLEVWSTWASVVASKVIELEPLLAGIDHPVINIGGGFASVLDADLDVVDRSGETPSLSEFAAVICGGLRQALTGSTTPWSDWTLEIEPGRGLHSDTGVHLTTVKNLKNETASEHRRWAEVDTSEVFLDLHGVPDECPLVFTSVSSGQSPNCVYDVVGLTCNAEMLSLDAKLPELSVGDVLAIYPTGAYLEPMAANFNALPRPGSVLLDQGSARLVKRHETVDDVFARDIIR
ncbi:MAG: diaminopimelate decarboxylase family protein [Luminiphilus sp.]|jgi:diaminopimelate decarboxylase